MKDYRKYLLGTVDSYRKAIKQKLMSEILEKGIATTHTNPTLLKEDVALGQIPKDLWLHECVEKSNRALKLIEKYEFEKSYHYSIVMRSDSELDFAHIEKMRSCNQIITFDEANLRQVDKLDCDTEEFTVATYFNSRYAHLFKLCTKVEQYATDGSTVYRKYPILIVVHNQNNIVEIRYDSVLTFSSTNVFYTTKINRALRWIENVLGLHIIEKDAVWARMKYIVEHKQELAQSNEAIITGQSMTFGNGSSADLYLGHSEAGLLPLIGELRQFLQDYESEFDNAPILKVAFEDFLREKEQDSDWPWVSLKLEVLDKKVELKYTADLYGQQVCRIMFYENNKYDARVMNYVIEYITKSISNNTADASANFQ